MDKPRQRELGASRLLCAAAFLVAAIFGGRSLLPSHDTATPARQTAAHSGAQAVQPIETIRVGQRVLSRNPDLREHGQIGETAVNPATWRHLTLRAVVHGDSDDEDRVEVETLQPPEWVAAFRAVPGETVPLPLDLVEMGLPENLQAEVVDNRPCPAIQGGAGRVVLTTVNHTSHCVGRLVIENERGEREAIRPTAFHKFYREPAGDWVSLEDLRPGDRLHGSEGVLTVVAVTGERTVQRVYNMTVEGEHVYYVSTLGLLAHNQDCKVTKGRTANVAEEAVAPARPAPAADNYRGRYQADLHQREIPRLPDDWDVHHRIPQDYIGDPRFSGFDFHAPSNTRGVQGSRSVDNMHQLITNRWAEFVRQNPNATFAEIEAFANEMDVLFAEFWWR